VLLDSHGLAGKSGGANAILAGGSGAPKQSGVSRSGAAILAGGSGAPSWSGVGRHVRCCYTSGRVRCSKTVMG
jgi:hypothetical protein